MVVKYTTYLPWIIRKKPWGKTPLCLGFATFFFCGGGWFPFADYKLFLGENHNCQVGRKLGKGWALISWQMLAVINLKTNSSGLFPPVGGFPTPPVLVLTNHATCHLPLPLNPPRHEGHVPSQPLPRELCDVGPGTPSVRS